MNLQKVYQAKAEADFLAMEKHVQNSLKKIGRDPNSISKMTIKVFCKNTRKLKVSMLFTIVLTNMQYCNVTDFTLLNREVRNF